MEHSRWVDHSAFACQLYNGLLKFKKNVNTFNTYGSKLYCHFISGQTGFEHVSVDIKVNNLLDGQRK